MCLRKVWFWLVQDLAKHKRVKETETVQNKIESKSSGLVSVLKIDIAVASQHDPVWY